MNDRSILVVNGYQASLFVESGHLVVRDGFPSEGQSREVRFPRGRCGITRIVVRASGGTISIPAIDWCARMGIAISIVASDSTLLNCLTPDVQHDAPVKRAQAVAATTDDGPRLARYVLSEKLSSQARTIRSDFERLGIGAERSRVDGARQIDAISQSLETAVTLVDFLTLEGRAAQIYWDLLTGSRLPWPDWCLKRIPSHWAFVSARTSGRRDRVRDATDPFNAMLNYGYTLLEIETRVACETHGLDPDLGFLHTDERLRESFVYDLLEPARSTVDVLILEYATKAGLRPHMFHELRDGVVRLDPDLAHSLTQFLVSKLAKAADQLASEFAKRLRLIKISYRLARIDRVAVSKRSSRKFADCQYCQQPLPRKGLKFCGRPCYLKYSVEVAKPIEKARVRLAEMRAAGLTPGHGGEAAKKRGAALAANNRRGVTGRRASKGETLVK